MFTDLCLADYLITNRLVSKCRFYVKMIPWFISDVTAHDFYWLIAQLRENYNQLQKLGNRWHGYLNSKIWSIEEHDFWTLPIGYSDMANVDPALYRKLSEAKLIIFKGDLNYRKLLNETNWEYTTPLEEAMKDFKPGRVAALRTLKADLVCGLAEGVADRAYDKDKNWLIDGEFGVIQYADTNKSIF